MANAPNLIPADLLERARSMRHEPAPAEAKLWRCLRDRQLGDYKFRRQTPQPPFIADFYCPQAKLIVELDGDSHAEQQAYDARRTQRLMRHGLHVIRFLNNDVIGNLDSVLLEILEECERLVNSKSLLDGAGESRANIRSKSPSPQPSPGVPGEGVAVDCESDANLRSKSPSPQPPQPSPGVPGEGAGEDCESDASLRSRSPSPQPSPGIPGEGAGVDGESDANLRSKSPSPQPSPGIPGEVAGVDGESDANLRSKSPSPQPSPGVPGEGVARRGFTLLEMLTTVAALVIVLGLMVDLARFVRKDSSVKLTKQLLYQCDVLLAQYRLHHHGQLPATATFADGKGDLDEASLQRRAQQNNRDFVAALRTEAGSGSALFGGLPDSMYNEATLSDAWGSPIVFMPVMHREIGIAPENRPFFFSAGADRLYLTQDDNLYSYEGEPAGGGKPE